jgi:hypothetical protein
LRRQRLAEKAKRMMIKYNAVMLAVAVLLIVAGYTRMNGLPATLSVAAGLALGASSPLLSFYITYRRVIRPLLREAGEQGS